MTNFLFEYSIVERKSSKAGPLIVFKKPGGKCPASRGVSYPGYDVYCMLHIICMKTRLLEIVPKLVALPKSGRLAVIGNILLENLEAATIWTKIKSLLKFIVLTEFLFWWPFTKSFWFYSVQHEWFIANEPGFQTLRFLTNYSTSRSS